VLLNRGFGWFPVLCFPFILSLGSCNNDPSPPPSSSNTILQTPEHKQLQHITDDILVALATHNYLGLEAYAPPANPPLTGSQIARLLLGDQLDSIMLDRWNAGKIQVSLTPDRLAATTKVNVTYRRLPNRPPRTREFTFRFERSSPQKPWRLQLQN
jgi:hypothetical protein